MSEEIAEMKSELEKTQNLVRLQRVRYQQLVSLFHVKLQEKEEETRADLQTKHAQLTCILRSLYILEAKLRKEQRTLKITLGERDALVKTQEHEIIVLKKQLETISCSKCAGNAVAAKVSANPSDNRCESDNKPDLISSIGIEVLKSDDSSPPPSTAPPPPSTAPSPPETDANTYVIASLDDYDASWSSLHVRGGSPDAASNTDEIDDQNASNENIRNRMIDEELQNEMRKFKMKEDRRTQLEEPFKTSSPRMILKEVTENPNEKLNGPVLNCVKQILSQDGDVRRHDKRKPAEVGDQAQRCPPTKPPKPALKPDSSRLHPQPHPRLETNVPKVFLRDNTFNVKPLPKPERQPRPPAEEADAKPSPGTRLRVPTARPPLSVVNGDRRKEDKAITSDESKIVQTVSALLSDSAESEDEQTDETSPTVSQMVKKFESLKSKKKAADAKQTSAGE